MQAATKSSTSHITLALASLLLLLLLAPGCGASKAASVRG